MLAHKAAEAEAIVEFADQPPHAVHAARERNFPLAELSFRGIAPGQPLVDGVGRHLPARQRQQDARGVERIEKTVSIADQGPAVAGRLSGAVRILLGSAEWLDALGAGDPRLHAGASGDLLEV